MAVNPHEEADEYLRNVNKKLMRVAREAHDALVEFGCDSYVKTIYIGYDIQGEMVAALYGHADYLEVALAVPQETSSDILVDASHLTWRTLPLAAVVRTSTDVKEFKNLVRIACNGVRTGKHTVNRDNAFFVEAKKANRRKSRGGQ